MLGLLHLRVQWERGWGSEGRVEAPSATCKFASLTYLVCYKPIVPSFLSDIFKELIVIFCPEPEIALDI